MFNAHSAVGQSSKQGKIAIGHRIQREQHSQKQNAAKSDEVNWNPSCSTFWIAAQERRVLEEFRLKSAELVEKEEDVEDEELSEVESEVSAKAGERSEDEDDDFDLDAIIMMTSDEEDAVVDSSEQSQVALADK